MVLMGHLAPSVWHIRHITSGLHEKRSEGRVQMSVVTSGFSLASPLTGASSWVSYTLHWLIVPDCFKYISHLVLMSFLLHVAYFR